MQCSTRWMCDYFNYAHDNNRPLAGIEDKVWTMEETEAWLIEHAEWQVIDEENDKGIWYLKEIK